MIIIAVALILEFSLCNLIINPNDDSEHPMAALLLLGVNIIIVCLAVLRSIKNEDHPEEENSVKTMIISSFFIRIAIMFWDVYARHIFILPNSEGDAEWYHIKGVRYAFGFYSDKVDFGAYSYYVGRVYKMIGVQKVTIQFLHIFLAICSILLIYKILLMFNVDTKIRRRAIAFACFLPNIMMITTFFLQESVISFMIILSLYCYTKWWFGNKFVYLILSFVPSLLASVLHTGAIAVAVGIFSLVFVVSGKDHALKISPLRVLSIVVLIFVGILILSQFGDTFTGKLRGGLSAESIVYERDVRESGGSGYSAGISGLPPTLDLIVNTPIRMIYFVFSPLPWAWRGLADIIAFFGSTLFYICTTYFSIKAIKRKPSRILKQDNISSYFLVLVVIILIAAIMFGWGVANAGSALRHREKFTYLFIILFAISKEIIYRTETQNVSEYSFSDSADIQRREISSQVR